MKNIEKFLLVTLFAVSTSTVFAGNSAELVVTGKLVPANCTPTFVGGGRIDLGNINKSSLSSAADTQVSVIDKNWSISCDAPVKIMINFTDSRPESGSLIGQFGLGMHGGSRIGYYNIRNDTPTLDGALGDAISSYDGGATWRKPSTGWYFNKSEFFSFADKGTLTPKAYKKFSGVFQVKLYITQASKLDLADAVSLDGLATLQVTYL